MNYPKVILFSLVIAAGGVILYVFFLRGSFLAKQDDLTSSSTSSTSLISLLPQINSEGEVTVKVSPQDLSQSATTWDFEILLDTHSGNLDQDLTISTVLIDDKGIQFKPISWEGDLPAGKADPPQGHHRQVILKFTPIAPRPKSIELRIFNIGDTGERIFSWELK